MFRKMGGNVGMFDNLGTEDITQSPKKISTTALTAEGFMRVHHTPVESEDSFKIKFVDGNIVITPPHDGCRLSFIDGGLKLLRG